MALFTSTHCFAVANKAARVSGLARDTPRLIYPSEERAAERVASTRRAIRVVVVGGRRNSCAVGRNI